MTNVDLFRSYSKKKAFVGGGGRGTREEASEGLGGGGRPRASGWTGGGKKKNG